MATTPYTLNVVNGTELQLSLSTAGPAGPAGDPTALLSSANTWTDTQSFLGFTVNGLSFYGPFATFTYTGSSADTHRTALGAAAAVHTHVSDDITDATDNAESGKIAKYTSTSGLFSLGLELYNGTSTTDLTPENGSANHTITVPAADGTMALTSDIPSTGTIAAQDADNVAITGGSLSGVTVNNYTKGVVPIGTVGASHTIDLTNGTFQTATLTASTASTFTMPTATAGKSFTLLLKQAATTGNGTATFTGVKWDENGTPTITATAGKMDILTFTADGTNWYGSIIQGFTP